MNAGAEIRTVQELVTTPYAILVAFGPDGFMGVDEAGGYQGMSLVKTPSPCDHACQVIVGVPARHWTYMPGSVTLIWDENAGVPDVDGDGLSDALEAALLTSPTDLDSDDDGLTDKDEVIGMDDPLLAFPMYGADPNRKDIFIEADWCYCEGLQCGGNQDFFRLDGDNAEKLAAAYGPDFALHLDTGVFNPDASTRGLWNDWHGASRRPENAPLCDGFSRARDIPRKFHHILTGRGPLGQGFGRCSGGPENVAILGQELGHNLLGPSHEGTVSSVKAGCKLNYVSVMNYGYDVAPPLGLGLSRGRRTTTLNPGALDEFHALMGLGDLASMGDLVGTLSQGPWWFDVRADSLSIDLNRDGRIEANARGPINYIQWGCGLVKPYTSWEMSRSEGPSLGRMADRLFLISTNTKTAQLEYRYATAFDAGNPVDLEAPSTRWTPEACASDPCATPPTPILGSSSAGRDVALVTMASRNEALLVYADPLNNLSYQRWRTDASQPMARNVVENGQGIQGSIAGAEIGGRVRIFAIQDSQLKRWDYDPVSLTWGGPAIELWSDGSPIAAKYGIALAEGYDSSIVGPQHYAAIPVPTPEGAQIEFARFDAGTLRFHKFGLEAWVDPFTRFSTEHRTNTTPGLAYAPFRRSESIVEGRFYLAYRAPGNGAVIVQMTQGNDSRASAPDRRLAFLFKLDAINEYYTARDWGISLYADPFRDDDPRGAIAVGGSDKLNFHPAFNGVFRAPARDSNDFAGVEACLADEACRR